MCIQGWIQLKKKVRVLLGKRSEPIALGAPPSGPAEQRQGSGSAALSGGPGGGRSPRIFLDETTYFD